MGPKDPLAAKVSGLHAQHRHGYKTGCWLTYRLSVTSESAATERGELQFLSIPLWVVGCRMKTCLLAFLATDPDT